MQEIKKKLNHNFNYTHTSLSIRGGRFESWPILAVMYLHNSTCFWGHYWFLFQSEVRALLLEGYRPKNVLIDRNRTLYPKFNNNNLKILRHTDNHVGCKITQSISFMRVSSQSVLWDFLANQFYDGFLPNQFYEGC